MKLQIAQIGKLTAQLYMQIKKEEIEVWK
jgi:hypothetical protein